MPDASILAQWQLSDLAPDARPYRPQEVVLPINALYSLPPVIPPDPPETVSAV